MSKKKAQPPSPNQTVYACTYMTKEAEKDVYGEGVKGRRHTVMAMACNITAGSLQELLTALGHVYALYIDDVFLPEDAPVDWIGFNRLETADGGKPFAEEVERWQRGELDLYLADYSFSIEKRFVAPIPHEEFAAAGIKTH